MKLVYEVLDQYHKARTKEDRVRILKENETWALKDIIRGTMDSTVQWNLPGGEPPYTPNEPHSTPSNLLKQNKQFTLTAVAIQKIATLFTQVNHTNNSRPSKPHR